MSTSRRVGSAPQSPPDPLAQPEPQAPSAPPAPMVMGGPPPFSPPPVAIKPQEPELQEPEPQGPMQEEQKGGNGQMDLVMKQLLDELAKAREERKQLASTVKVLQKQMTELSQRTPEPQLGPEPGELREDMMYIRIKPLNPSRKHFRRRQYTNELGFVAIGGTGRPGDIPRWYEVTPDVAAKLQRYRQRDNDPDSPQVFDIATPEERRAIDSAEESWRRAHLGISTAPMEAARASKAKTQRRLVEPAPVRRPPEVIEAAKTFTREKVPQSMGGREEALEGIEVVSEELSDEMESALAHAAANPVPKVHGMTGGVARE